MQESWISILPLFLLATVGWILYTYYLATTKKLPEELGKKPILETTSGGFFGNHRIFGHGLKGPFIRVSFYSDFCVVVSKPFQCKFLYSEIQELRFEKSFLASQLFFSHKNPEYPRIIWVSVSSEFAESAKKIIKGHNNNFY